MRMLLLLFLTLYRSLCVAGVSRMGESDRSVQTASHEQQNREAEARIARAYEAILNNDFATAHEQLTAAERLNSKERNLWSTYGALYAESDQPEHAIEAFRAEIRNWPDNLGSYRALAQLQRKLGQEREAEESLAALLAISPGDEDGTVQLSSLLLAQKRYGEVPGLVRPSLAQHPENLELKQALAESLLRTGHVTEGVQTIRELVASSQDPIILNNTAYLLVEAKADLPLAKEYAEHAVRISEEQLKDLDLSKLTEADLRHQNELASYWDTLGCIYLQAGQTTEAERFLTAAWQLSAHDTVADHLAQLSSGKNALKNASAPLKVRTVTIPVRPATAKFQILFSHGKPLDAKFIGGAESLKNSAGELLRAHVHTAFPDDGPEKIVRSGILTCDIEKSACKFTILAADSPMQTVTVSAAGEPLSQNGRSGGTDRAW